MVQICTYSLSEYLEVFFEKNNLWEGARDNLPQNEAKNFDKAWSLQKVA